MTFCLSEYTMCLCDINKNEKFKYHGIIWYFGIYWHELDNISSAECMKVVSDIFSEIGFLMEYENIGLCAHFSLFLKFLALLFSKILSKMCSKNATYDPIALIFDKCV